MPLFGKKKSVQTSKGPPQGMTGSLLKIPDAFYGGADPVVHYASELARVAPAAPPKKTAVAAVSVAKRARGPKHKKLLLAAGGLFFAIFIGITSWYYIRQAVPAPIPPKPSARPAAPSAAPVPPPPPVVVPPPPPVVVPPPPSIPERLGQFPRLLFVDSPDIDADTLTDAEEALLGTDSGIWDSDKDGYFDGQEVVNLYNPLGFAPIRIIDSGLVREYVHPRLQYRMYYPSGWEVAAVDPAGDQIIFSDISGDFVETRVFRKSAEESFESWFGRTVAGEQITDLIPFFNRFREDGRRRRDNLIAYVDRGDVVYVLIYHPITEDAIRFRQVMSMMWESFRPGETQANLPPQPVLPEEPTTTE